MKYLTLRKYLEEKLGKKSKSSSFHLVRTPITPSSIKSTTDSQEESQTPFFRVRPLILKKDKLYQRIEDVIDKPLTTQDKEEKREGLEKRGRLGYKESIMEKFILAPFSPDTTLYTPINIVELVQDFYKKLGVIPHNYPQIKKNKENKYTARLSFIGKDIRGNVTLNLSKTQKRLDYELNVESFFIRKEKPERSLPLT